jgi:hypothetical protein
VVKINNEENNHYDDSVWSTDQNISIFDLKKRRIQAANGGQSAYKREFNRIVIKVNSLNSFYVQLENADTQLMNMKESIDKCCAKLDTPNEGSLCVAKYYVDDQLLRAQILKKEKEKANLLFIDYGNTVSVNLNELYRMSPDLKVIPPLAIHCSLVDIKNDKKLAKSVELIDKFKLITSKSKVNIKILKPSATIQRIGTHLMPFEVDLFIGPVNIRHHLNIIPNSGSKFLDSHRK